MKLHSVILLDLVWSDTRLASFIVLDLSIVRVLQVNKTKLCSLSLNTGKTGICKSEENV